MKHVINIPDKMDELRVEYIKKMTDDLVKHEVDSQNLEDTFAPVVAMYPGVLKVEIHYGDEIKITFNSHKSARHMLKIMILLTLYDNALEYGSHFDNCGVQHISIITDVKPKKLLDGLIGKKRLK